MTDNPGNTQGRVVFFMLGGTNMDSVRCRQVTHHVLHSELNWKGREFEDATVFDVSGWAPPDIFNEVDKVFKAYPNMSHAFRMHSSTTIH